MFNEGNPLKSPVTSIYHLLGYLKRPLYRNALYLMLNTATTYLSGFIFWIVVARFYSETEVGYGSAIISAVSLLSVLSIAGLNYSIIRFLPHTKHPHELINSGATFAGLLSLVAAAVFVVGIDFWSPALSFVKDNAIFFVVFLVATLISTLSQLVDSVFVAERRADLALYRSIIFALLRIPLPVAFIVFFHTFGVVTSWGIALGIALLIAVFVFVPRIIAGYKPKPTFDLSPVHDIRYYSGPSYLTSLIAQAPHMLLPLMVVNLLGTNSNAHFYIASMIAFSLSAISLSVSQSLFAEGSISPEDIRRKVISSLKFTFLLLVPAVVVLIVTAKWLLLAFGSSYAENAVSLMYLLGLASLPRGINYIYFSLLRVQNRLKELIIIQVVIAIAILIPSLLFMPVYGIIGIGYVWLGVHIMAATVLAVKLAARVRQSR